MLYDDQLHNRKTGEPMTDEELRQTIAEANEQLEKPDAPTPNDIPWDGS